MTAAKLQETPWLLERLARDAPLPGPPPTLRLSADGGLAGSTGLNRFFGTWSADGVKVRLDVAATTLMAGPAPLMAQETAVLAALRDTARARIDDEGLALLDEGGVVLLRYVAGLTELPGTSWTAQGVNNGAGGLVSTSLTGRVTAQFGPDGRLSGCSGVNRYSAAYAVDGRTLTLGPAIVTLMAGPPDLMDLEEQYLSALSRVARWETDGLGLTLRDAEGATQVLFAPDR